MTECGKSGEIQFRGAPIPRVGKIPRLANSRSAKSDASIWVWAIPAFINSGVTNSSVGQFQRLSIFGGIQFRNGPIPVCVNARVDRFRSGPIPALGHLQSCQFPNGPILGRRNSRVGEIQERGNSRVANSDLSIPGWVIPARINSGSANSSVGQFHRLSIFGGIQFRNGPIPGCVNSRVDHFRVGQFRFWANYSVVESGVGRLQCGQFRNDPIPAMVNSGVAQFRNAPIPEWANSDVDHSRRMSIPDWIHYGANQFRRCVNSRVANSGVGQLQSGQFRNQLQSAKCKGASIPECCNSGVIQFRGVSIPEWLNSGLDQFRCVSITEWSIPE